MSSLYDDLCEKLKNDPRLTKRADIEVIRAKSEGHPPSERLGAAVEDLRPLFKERGEP